MVKVPLGSFYAAPYSYTSYPLDDRGDVSVTAGGRTVLVEIYYLEKDKIELCDDLETTG